jgi:hypothetical protein
MNFCQKNPKKLKHSPKYTPNSPMSFLTSMQKIVTEGLSVRFPQIKVLTAGIFTYFCLRKHFPFIVWRSSYTAFRNTACIRNISRKVAAWINCVNHNNEIPHWILPWYLIGYILYLFNFWPMRWLHFRCRIFMSKWCIRDWKVTILELYYGSWTYIGYLSMVTVTFERKVLPLTKVRKSSGRKDLYLWKSTRYLLWNESSRGRQKRHRLIGVCFLVDVYVFKGYFTEFYQIKSVYSMMEHFCCRPQWDFSDLVDFNCSLSWLIRVPVWRRWGPCLYYMI